MKVKRQNHQKRYFLREQVKAIQEELGEGENSLNSESIFYMNEISKIKDMPISTKEELFEGLFIAIRQFAKRQETWFRMMEKKGVEIKWLEPGSKEERIAQACGIIKTAGV